MSRHESCASGRLIQLLYEVGPGRVEHVRGRFPEHPCDGRNPTRTRAPWDSGPAVFWNVSTSRRLQGEAWAAIAPNRPNSGGWPHADAMSVLDSARSNIRPAFVAGGDCPAERPRCWFRATGAH